MRRLTNLLLLGALCLPALQLRAQEKTKAEEHVKVSVPVKVQIIFTEFDGDKKISSMPYTFAATTGEGTSIRNGVRIPIEVDGKDQKTTYLDLGSNIDCRVGAEEDGHFHLSLIFERSSIHQGSAAGEEKLEVSRPNGQPLIRTFRTNENMILKDGQTLESVLSTDPLNGHTLRVSVTINVQK